MLNYCSDTEQARILFDKYSSSDPFPEIQPALLNSADIQDYVSATGMICPFNPKDENFKPASYSINFNGKYLYWDIDANGKKKKEKGELKDGEHLMLRRNSITFIQLEPYIQLPYYIAARFNFQIKHVYRGLLLGTGPLVDPGFRGYLNIPIHNLTDEEYEIQKGEPIIWMEFTKLTYNKHWKLSANKTKRQGKFVEFNKYSNDVEIDFYLHKANPNSSIMSSLPNLIHTYEATLKDSEKTYSRTDTLLKWFNLTITLSILGLIGAVAGFGYHIYTIGKNTNDYIIKSQEYINKEHDLSVDIKLKANDLQTTVDSLKEDNNLIKNELLKLKNKIR